MYIFDTWIAILCFASCSLLNFAQDVIRSWLFIRISEGHIYTPLVFKGLKQFTYRAILTTSKRKYIVQKQKVQSRTLFLLLELPMYSYWVVLCSSGVVLYLCCLMLYSYRLVLPRVLLILCCFITSDLLVLPYIVSCSTPVVSCYLVLYSCCVAWCCYLCSFLD